MNFEYSEKTQRLREQLLRFFDAHIYPNEKAVGEWVYNPENAWKNWPGLENLKEEARREGLWLSLIHI